MALLNASREEKIRTLELLRERDARRARDCFLTYRKEVNPNLMVNWWVKDVCDNLQQFYQDIVDKKRPVLIVEAPPQHGKSAAVTDFISWIAGKNPDLKTIFASFSDNLGQRTNRAIQRTLDSETYSRIFPGTRISGESATSGRYLRNQNQLEYVDRFGGFRNTTVQGAITGEGLDLGVIDDPIKGRIAANSKTVRDGTWDWLNDDFFTRYSEYAATLIVLTRWHIDDPVGRLIEQDPEGVKVLKYKAIATEDEQHRDKGEALFPEHKSLEFLETRKKRMTVSSWESLYQQSPFQQGGKMFEVDLIETVDYLPEGLNYIRGWDFAGTQDGGDWTATVKLGVDDQGTTWIADVQRAQRGPAGVERFITEVLAGDPYDVYQSFPQDPAQAGKAQAQRFSAKLFNTHPHSHSLETGNKLTRMLGFAAQVGSGNVKMLKAAWNKDFKGELELIPNGINDDQADAASRAYNHSTKQSSIGVLIPKRLRRG